MLGMGLDIEIQTLIQEAWKQLEDKTEEVIALFCK